MRGVGPKTACKILEEHNWDLLLAIEKAKKLWGKRDIIERNLQLMDLRTFNPARDVVLPPVPLFEPVRLGDNRYEALVAFLRAYQLGSVSNLVAQNRLWETVAHTT